MRTYCYGAKAPIEGANLVRQVLERAHRYYNDRIAFLRVESEARARAALADPAAREAAKKLAHEEMLAAERETRSRCGFNDSPGTYLQIEDATRKAAAMSAVVTAKKEGTCPRCKAPFATGEMITIHTTKKLLLACAKCGNGPRPRRWDDSGLVAAQLQYGRSDAEIEGGEDRHVRLVGEGKHRVLWLRVGTDESRGPIWTKFPIVYHRPLPAGASAKWVRMCVRRVGTKLKWDAQFVIEVPSETWALPPPTLGTIAVDVGWRDFGADGLRVATWVDDTGAAGELRLPRAMLDRDQKVSDLRSIRGKAFNAARDRLVDERRAHGEGWPTWLREETHSLHQWRSTTKLAGLVSRWGRRMPAPMAPACAEYEAWRAQDKHLLEWEANQREAILRERREVYRLFALQLARYRKVVMERLALDELAEVAEKPEDRLTHNSRSHRFDAALSFLMNFTADAVTRAGGEFAEVPAPMTTQWCHTCGQEERFDAAPKVDHTCSHCGTAWDQDVNAARNLLVRAATWCVVPGTRSRAKVADPTKETDASVWRRKGLEKRRARRSKMAEQDGENTSNAT